MFNWFSSEAVSTQVSLTFVTVGQLLFCIFEFYYYSLRFYSVISFYLHNNICFQLIYSFSCFVNYRVLTINWNFKVLILSYIVKY
jgi:hypothetical protein